MMENADNNLKPHVKTGSAKPTALVVDDQLFMRKIFSDCLEAIGCHVVEASDGLEAIEIFQQKHPNLVILDMVMPGMDGFAACAALRSIDQGRHTPILAVTSLTDANSIKRAFEAGATDCIAKPVTAELLGYRARYLLRASEALEELGRSESNLRMLKAAVECLPIGITISNAEGKIIYINPADAKMHGFSMGELLDKDARMLAPPRLHQSSPAEKQEKTGVWQRESVNRRKNGEEFPVQLTSVAVRNPQKDILGIVTICEDITERKKNEDKIQHLAYYDMLTGLPNRTLFLDRLQKALLQADRSKQHEEVTVLFLDLDNFKDINDTLGHDCGDKLLTEVAHRLSNCVRAADTLARLGGDEFVVMLARTQGEGPAGVLARRILAEFKTPFEINGRKIFASMSIGIAIYPNDASDMEGLLRSADTAMYKAKASGRNDFQFFSAKMNKEIVEKVALETALRQALERKEINLVYQPQWDIQSGLQCGVEALARWHNAELGEISPARFIPLAESSGQIHALGEMILRLACTQAKAWADSGYPMQTVAVNVSGHQLRHRDFPDLVERILAETQLDPSCLELECTESVLMDHAEQTVALLQSLKALGLQLAIDDFGTGYSSLSYLKHFPVDRIKIDRSFVSGIEDDPRDAAIVEAVIALAKTLKMSVLAEGVETLPQLKFLQDHSCNEVQGYLLGGPMAEAALRRHELTPDCCLLMSSGNS